MCGNAAVRGGRFAARVFDWAIRFAIGAGRAFVRMDTWAEKEGPIAYYERCGFVRVGTRVIGDERRLPPHYQGISLALFENAVSPHGSAGATP